MITEDTINRLKSFFKIDKNGKRVREKSNKVFEISFVDKL